jgi:hypothetical protein
MFYEIMPFSYIDCWGLQLIDNTYHGDITYGLTQGRRLKNPPASLDVAVYDPGQPMDFSITEMGIPVVSERAARLLEDVARDDIQMIPARIEGATDSYWVLNITSRLDCVDRDKSSVVPVEGPGGGHIATDLYVIDPQRVGRSELFRLKNDYLRMIVTERLKDAFVSSGQVGPGLVAMQRELVQIMPGFQRRGRKRGRKNKRAQ